MAGFKADIPEELMKQLSKLEKGTMPQEMLKAGAEEVMSSIRANVPQGIRDSDMMSCLSETEIYETPTDGGVNIKVGFSGYFTNEKGKKTPAPLVANLYEYGRSNAPFPKQPFMRRSFNRQRINAAMKAVQNKYIPGGD